MIRLAARRFGIALDAYEAGYDQVEQELLDPGSGLYEFGPDYVLIAAHDGAARLDESVEAEADRWTGLWQLARERSGARVVQHSFAVAPESPLGNLAAQVQGSRPAMLAALNARLAEAAGDDVLLVDCERLAALVGKRRWFDPRYWHLAKQAVSLAALPLLARQTAAVIAADLGLEPQVRRARPRQHALGRRDRRGRPGGHPLGGDAEGEAFAAFQQLPARRSAERGDPARRVLEEQRRRRARAVRAAPGDGAAASTTSPRSAPTGSRSRTISRAIADELDIGIDSLVFVDDNPAEREALRQSCRRSTCRAPRGPAGYVGRSPTIRCFEPSASPTRTRSAPSSTAAARGAQGARQGRPTCRATGAASRCAPRSPRSTSSGSRAHRAARRQDEPVQRDHHGATARRPIESLRRARAGCTCTAELRDRFADHGVVALVAFARQTARCSRSTRG